jgi:hypothetical protein
MATLILSLSLKVLSTLTNTMFKSATHPKSHYLPSLTILTTVSLSSGLVAFITQFLLHHPDGSTCPTTSTYRIHVLLAVSSLIFLSNVLSSLILNTLLHPLHDSDLVKGNRRTLFRCGIAVIYTFLSVGFVLFAIAVAVAVAYPGPKGTGYVGIGLFGVLVVALLVLGLCTKSPGEDENVERANDFRDPFSAGILEKRERRNVADVGLYKVCVYVLVFVVLVGGLVVLLVMGGSAVRKGNQVGGACAEGANVAVGAVSVWTRENPLPVDVVLGEAVTIDIIVTEGRVTTATMLASGSGSESTSGGSGVSGGGVATVVDLTSVTTSTTTTVLVTAGS